MSKVAVWSVIIAFVSGILGAVLTFVPPKTIVSAGLGFGRHNDRVLVGVLLLIIFVVAVYKLLTLVLGHKPVKAASAAKKTAGKKAKRRKK